MTGDPGSQAQAQEDKQRQVEDMKNSILNQVLTQEARARCKYWNGYCFALKYLFYCIKYHHQCHTISIYCLVNTLRVAKPEKGQKIEAMLIQMAQTGQLGGRIGEEDLIGLLGRFVPSKHSRY